MVNSNGKVVFHGTLLAGLLICTSIGHYVTNTDATPSMKVMEKDQQKQENTTIKEKINQSKFIEKTREKLKRKGYQVGFILSIYSEDHKELEVVVRSEMNDQEKATKEITRIVEEVAKENKLGLFNTTVNFPNDE
ncbi:hypothetical protein [Rummeliibacillus pycnus]|uniref:hypothetical protein n=1 Tax=Rummeliibacillus pycnus TaxID=101070 RepID=UPI000C9D1208|nr:hypothetical protein [Rummeliibacillus pycnus]